MIEKGGNFSAKLLQNLPFISSQILYFALFSRSVESGFYLDTLLLITVFLQRYVNRWRRENLHVNLLRKDFCFLFPQQIFQWSTHLTAGCDIDFFEVQIAALLCAEQSREECDFVCALLCLWHINPAAFPTLLQSIKNRHVAESSFVFQTVKHDML